VPDATRSYYAALRSRTAATIRAIKQEHGARLVAHAVDVGRRSA
jgi:hypothetical protein